MKTCGIIVEYNPFTYGHLYHINKARELTNCDCLIAVMSGNFVQRGEVSIIDKWQRAKCAIENNVDLVVELPYVYSNQSASHFAHGAINILKALKVDYICFGSESNDLETLKDIADTSINVDHLKESMSKGLSYAQSLSILQGSYGPNDILGIAYLKELKDSNIIPISIQRTNNYHDKEISSEITSATSIRHALYQNKDYIKYTPMNFDYYNKNEYYFKYLKQLLMTLSKEYLHNIFLVSEGIENHLVKCIEESDNYDDFINKAITRRYTKARIQRVLMNILNHVTKDDIKKLKEITYIRPLAFNEKGQVYLKSLKKDENLNFANRFAQIEEGYRKIEYKATCTYTMNLSKEKAQELLTRELQGPLIIK